MFSASWNQPSQLMTDSFWDLAMDKSKKAIFLEVDVDKFKVYIICIRLPNDI
jgi:hypothetical protein